MLSFISQKDTVRGKNLLLGSCVLPHQTPATHVASPVFSYYTHSAFPVSHSCTVGDFFNCQSRYCTAPSSTQHLAAHSDQPHSCRSLIPPEQRCVGMPPVRCSFKNNFPQNLRVYISSKFQKFQRDTEGKFPASSREWISVKSTN